MGQRYEPVAGRSRRGHHAPWPMSPAARLSDPDIMSRYRMTPSRSRPRPGLGIAERCAARGQGAEAKARRANPHFCAARLCRSGVEVSSARQWSPSSLEDLEAKPRGLWWGCGEWTTRSFSNPLSALSPTLWPCGKKQVERFFSNL